MPMTELRLRQEYWVVHQREQDASGRLAEMEEQFVVQLDELAALKRERHAMITMLECFKRACDANDIEPEFPASVEAVRATLYSPATVGAGAADSAKELEWVSLSEVQQAAARRLGWGKETWDAGSAAHSCSFAVTVHLCAPCSFATV